MTANPASVSRSMKLRDKVSPEEWQARVDLAACYRLVAYYDMTDLTFTHISARIPGQPDHFLLNPFGMMFEEITASSLVKTHMDGTIDKDSPYEYIPAGYTIHSAVLHARPDVECVLHTHTSAGMAVSSLECGLLPMTQTSLRFHNNIAYHDYEGVATDLDERERLARDLGKHQSMILKNHGLLTTGRSIAEAFVLMHRLEKACRSQIEALSTGQKPIALSDAVKDHTAKQFNGMHLSNQPIYGDREWPSLCRMMDRVDPSYKM
jgi:ribulose-5-phosphate 4-epimerase/fuculose-1-phosphate aldolase